MKLWVDKTKELLYQGGRYINELFVAELDGRRMQGGALHDAMQLLSWAHILLEGREIGAWGTDTQGITKKMRDGADRLYRGRK